VNKSERRDAAAWDSLVDAMQYASPRYLAKATPDRCKRARRRLREARAGMRHVYDKNQFRSYLGEYERKFKGQCGTTLTKPVKRTTSLSRDTSIGVGGVTLGLGVSALALWLLSRKPKANTLTRVP
jgi:hypothetical protein